MKKKSAKVRSTVTKALDLPGDILLDQPRLVLDGFHALHMENHKGITEYSGERLCMKVQGGSVCITCGTWFSRNWDLAKLLCQAGFSPWNGRRRADESIAVELCARIC